MKKAAVSIALALVASIIVLAPAHAIACTVNFTSGNYLTPESDDVVVTVERTECGTDGGQSVQYKTNNATAAAGEDYTEKSGTLSFSTGSTSRTITVPITDDQEPEEVDETFTIQLTKPSDGVTVGATGTATVTILGNDSQLPALFQFSASNYSVAEDGTTLVTTVVRSRNTSNAHTVSYTTQDGSADAGADYTATTGTLSFSSGTVSKTISIPIIDDVAPEGAETFTIRLTSTSTGSTLGPVSTAVATINDDEELLASPSPTATATPTPTPTPTQSASPTPTPTASSSPSPTPTTSPAPEPVTFSRNISLRLRKHLIAAGSVSSSDGPGRCRQGVAVKVQRLRLGRWKVIARTTTDRLGAYKQRLADRPGRYRAIAPKVRLANGDSCAAARSGVKRHRH